MSASNTAPTASIAETRPTLSRTNIVLLVLLLVQLAIVAYFFWPSNQTSAGGQPLLPGVTAESVSELTITDNNNGSVSFIKEGDTWSVAGTDGYPALNDKITETLDKLLAINTDRLVTQTPGSHERLQVAENNFQRRVDITSTATSGVQTLFIGSSSGASATHVRAAGEDATYLTGAFATWELDTIPTSWMDVTYVSIPKDQMQEITLQNANGIFTFIHSGTDWTLADATPDEAVAPANINTVLDRLTTLNLTAVVGKSDSPDYGLSTPLATIIITSTGTLSDTGTVTDTVTDTVSPAQAEVKTTTLLIGTKDEANNAYYAKSSDSDYYVRIAAFTGDDLVNKTRNDLMIQAPDAAIDSTTLPQERAASPEALLPSNESITDTVEVTDTTTITN